MQPIENRVQDFINSLDQGLGQKLVRVFLFLFLILLVFVFYTLSQFRGLRTPEAMEYAQLARNMAVGKGFSTSCIRPADMWYLKRHSGREYAIGRYPDIRHGPVFPALLSLGFRIVKPSFVVKPGIATFRPESQVIIPICIFFSMATGFLVFLMGKLLFDRRIAVVSTVIYFLSETVLAHSVTGLPMSLLTFLVTAASYAVLSCALRKSEGRPFASWFRLFLLSAFLCAVSFLTGYRMVVLVPMLGVFLWLSIESPLRLFPNLPPAGRGWQAESGKVPGFLSSLTSNAEAMEMGRLRPAGQGHGIWRWQIPLGFLLVFILLISPWLIRNRVVSGGMFGVAPYSMLQHSSICEDDSFDRQLRPYVSKDRIARALKVKLISNFSRAYDVNLRTLGSGLIICFFLVSFFHKFEDEKANLFRWCLALAILLMMFADSLCGGDSVGTLNVFLPMIILYGTAFFFTIIDRLEFEEFGWQTVLICLFVLLSALPAALTVFGPRVRVPYPPYFPPFVSYVCKLLEPHEAICTDIPWATAWYGNRSSILLPSSIDDFYEISGDRIPVKGLYLTTETGDKPYISSLATGEYSSWLPVLNRRIPGDFPLTQGIALPPGSRDQLFLTDRIRWNEKKQSSLAEGEEREFKVRARE